MAWPKGKSQSPESKAKRKATLAQNGKRHKKPRLVGGAQSRFARWS